MTVSGTPRKVAIVGFSETTRHLAPFADPSFEIWGLNHLYPYIPRWDVWFDMHSPEWSAAHLAPEVWKEHEAFLRTAHGKPIYMLERYPDFPSSLSFPKAEVSERFRRYFTNGVAYMIALALYQGVTELHVYGVEMRHDTEYAAQRPCTEWWLALAEGMGVKVVLPAETALLSCDGDYGYLEATGAWAEAERAALERLKEIDAQLASWNRKNDEAVRNLQTYDGARQEVLYWLARYRQRARGGVL